MYFPFSMFALLVRFRSVQPNAADEGADHPCDDDGEANPPGVHFFSLKKAENNEQRPKTVYLQALTRDPHKEVAHTFLVLQTEKIAPFSCCLTYKMI